MSGNTAKTMGSYKGLIVKHNEDGYFAKNGADTLGYCETVVELCVEIDDYFQETQFGEDNGIFTKEAS